MTSTLPDFSANIAAAAPGSNALSSAERNSAGAAAADHGGDFADLLPPPKPEAPAETVGKATASAPSILSLCVSAAEETAATEVATDASAEAAPPVSRDTLEAAAAFAATLLQALLPEVTVPAALEGTRPCVPPTANMISEPARRDAGPPANASVEVVATAAEAGAGEFQVAHAADGAVEIKLELPENKTAGDADGQTGLAFEVRAELELPGQAVTRLEARGEFSSKDGAQNGQAIFAAKMNRARDASVAGKSAGERNFVFTGDKQVKPRSPESGITVAKTDSIMPAAPIEEVQTARSAEPSAVSFRSDFQVMPTPAERITAPAEVSAGQNFAERAVATVTSLVDAQFSASMQKSGSVQLRLKFGGEDLSVRVELRGGAVHTDFRTDSAELRAALSREMQAVASQSPEQLRRYVAPVFSPAETPSHSGNSQQQSGRQQQQAAQQDLPQRSPRALFEEAAPFAGHSLLRDTFFPEPVAAHAPVLLPTSLRLSALA